MPSPPCTWMRTVDHVVEHARREELDQRDLDARLVALVEPVRRLQRHQPARLDLGGGVGDPVLHRLLVRERLAERLALERVRAHQLERALHLAEPAHDVVDATRAEPLLRDPEAVAGLAERIRHGHADVRGARLAVRSPAAPFVPHHRDIAHELVPRRVGRDDDHRRAPVRLRVGIGHEHDDPEAGAVGARREPLVRVDHPLVAVPHGPAAQQRRVGAGHLGLGHAEERAHLAGDERREPALPLLLRPVEMQDLAVPRVGRLAAEDQLGDEAAADLLVQIRVLEEAAAAAARLRRQVRRPEARLLRLLPQLADQRVRFVVLPEERRLVRVDVLLHERPNPRAAVGDQVGDDSGHGWKR